MGLLFLRTKVLDSKPQPCIVNNIDLIIISFYCNLLISSKGGSGGDQHMGGRIWEEWDAERLVHSKPSLGTCVCTSNQARVLWYCLSPLTFLVCFHGCCVNVKELKHWAVLGCWWTRRQGAFQRCLGRWELKYCLGFLTSMHSKKMYLRSSNWMIMPSMWSLIWR